MSHNPSAPARLKTLKLVCDRCRQPIEALQSKEFVAGFYDMTKWQEYRRANELHVCRSCMFADPKYVDRYGSSF